MRKRRSNETMEPGPAATMRLQPLHFTQKKFISTHCTRTMNSCESEYGSNDERTRKNGKIPNCLEVKSRKLWAQGKIILKKRRDRVLHKITGWSPIETTVSSDVVPTYESRLIFTQLELPKARTQSLAGGLQASVKNFSGETIILVGSWLHLLKIAGNRWHLSRLTACRLMGQQEVIGNRRDTRPWLFNGGCVTYQLILF